MDIAVSIKVPTELVEALNNLAAAIAATSAKNPPFLTIDDIAKNIDSAQKEKMIESLKEAVIVSSVDTPAPDPAESDNPEEEQKVTSDILRAAFMEKVKSGKSDQLKNILTEMGFEKLSDIPEDSYTKAYGLVKAV